MSKVKFEGITKDINTNTQFYSFSTQGDFMQEMSYTIVEEVLRMAAEKIAEEFLKQHIQEILSKLDSQAILNLALAKSAAKVFDDVKSK